MAEPHATAVLGLPELDLVLGGLYWGDNVVWEAEEEDALTPFYRAIALGAAAYDTAAFVTVSRAPEEVRAAYPTLDVLDARRDTPLGQPRPLLEAIRERCRRPLRHLLLFDSLEAMSVQWGAEIAGRFFARGCPLLLGLGAVAHWSLVPARQSPALRREIDGLTQCVLVLADGRVRIAKAEGRPPDVVGSVFRYRLENGVPRLEPAPAAARLGAALRALRLQRRLSQSELARLAGVSPSAISQAERGQRGLSLQTLIDLAARLNITIDELLRGDVAPGYRIVRRDDPRQTAENAPVLLLDDPAAGLRAYLVRLTPGGSAAPDFPHKGVELVAVAQGLVQVILPAGRPVLRQGEALIAETSTISGWRNLSEREAMLFWILRDDASRPGGADWGRRRARLERQPRAKGGSRRGRCGCDRRLPAAG